MKCFRSTPDLVLARTRHREGGGEGGRGGGGGGAMGEAAIVPAVHDTNVILMW